VATLIYRLTLISYAVSYTLMTSISIGFPAFLYSIPLTLAIIFKNKIPKIIWIASGVFFTLTTIFSIFDIGKVFFLNYAGICYLVIVLVYYLFTSWKTLKGSKRAFVIGIGMSVLLLLIQISLLYFVGESAIDIANIIFPLLILSLPISLLVYILLWLKESQKEKEKNVSDLIKITQEKKALLENQNIRLEKDVTERTAELNKSLQNLKSTQAQLIQSEKMASLGELTAGIAHEIQNPLNFVNNFSEVSEELVDEIEEERAKNQETRDEGLVSEILIDIKNNLSKINHHGKRADAIVKGMLEHSRTNKGEKNPTDINALIDEFVRLSYHGLRAKNKNFNADYKLDLDPNLPKANVISPDIGRVILNLVNNAFFAVNEKAKTAAEGYNPEIRIQSKPTENGIQLTIEDNGDGIPKDMLDKIFQPFFTTKPTGEGTGLGLSLSYDIIKAHDGNLNVESEEGKGTRFTINLPVNS
jgi:signal transduction histidine kinase